MCFVQKKYIYMCCVQEKYLYSCIHVSCINEKYIYSCIRMHYVQEKLILLMHSHVLCPGKIHFTGTHAFTVGVSVILYLVLTWLCTVQRTNVHCTLCRIYCSTVCKSGIWCNLCHVLTSFCILKFLLYLYHRSLQLERKYNTIEYNTMHYAMHYCSVYESVIKKSGFKQCIHALVCKPSLKNFLYGNS